MKREIFLIAYMVIITALFLIGFLTSDKNKFEYGLVGAFVGVILSLILSVTIGEKLIKKSNKDEIEKIRKKKSRK